MRLQQKTNLIKELKTNVTYQRYPGVEETNITYTSNKGVPIALFFLKANLNNPNVTIEAGTPYDKPAFARQTIRDMIPYKNASNSKRKVIAAINGDYYSWTGEPDGVVIKNGAVIKEAPDDKFFFSIRNDGTAMIGDKRIYNATAATLQQAIGGRFYLMHYGETMTEHLKDVSVEPRTTVGVLSPNHVVFTWVDGRRTRHYAGLSLTDMANIYKAIGATDVLNMDGGGSTTFIMRDNDGTYQTRNKPSDNSERANANALMVMMKSEIIKNNSRHFSAEPAGSAVKLTWTTDTESEVATYAVERSRDGKTFEATGIELRQDNNVKTPAVHESFDNNPYIGTSFNRLKKTAYDGRQTFGLPVSVELVTENNGVVIYPNPVKNKVMLSVEAEAANQNLTFRLLDGRGNIMQAYKGALTDINNQLNRRLKTLKPDIYAVTISSETNTYTSRFIKE